MFALQRKQWKIICQRGHQSVGLKQQKAKKGARWWWAQGQNNIGCDHMVKDPKEILRL